MVMITVTKEELVRALLKEKLSNREVARRAGVNKGTVATIRKLPNLRRRRPPRQASRRLKKSRRCTTCRGMVSVWPCPLCSPKYDNSKSTVIPYKHKALIAEAPELFHIVHDVQELHKLNLFSHSLFHTLARRARDSLRRISNDK